MPRDEANGAATITGGTPRGSAQQNAPKKRAIFGPRARQNPTGTPKIVANIAVKTQSCNVPIHTPREAPERSDSCHSDGILHSPELRARAQLN
jgi:hypothetical protein